MSDRRRLLLIIGLLALAIVAVDYGREWWRIDYCLDAGGSFDYTRWVCDFEAQHKPVSYLTRRPGARILASSGLAMLFYVLLIRR